MTREDVGTPRIYHDRKDVLVGYNYYSGTGDSKKF